MPSTQRRSGRPWPGVLEAIAHEGIPNPALTDRELHDRLITYLTDANLRSADTSIEFLDDTEAERAQRFSRFLARRYYRDRLHRAFHYSTNLVKASNVAADVVEIPEFDVILDGCVLGSLATAKAVGDLALSSLRSERTEEWWSEVLNYEFAFFLQLATLETTSAGTVPQRALSTVIHEFQFQIPEILARLRRGDIPDTNPRSTTTLLFSRTPHGRIYVVELDAAAAAVAQSVDGKRVVGEIAGTVGISLEETTRILAELLGINAIVRSFETG